eukprot:244960_1
MSLVTNEIETEESSSLKVYLNNKLIQLNSNQILRIQHIIDTSQQSEQLTQYNMKSGFVYRFDVNFTFAQSLCGEKRAQKIKQIVNHKVTMALLVLVVALLLSTLFMASWTVTLIATWTMPIFYLPWLLFKHLLLNKTAFKICLKSFDFWIKILYGLMYMIALGLNTLELGSPLLWFLGILMFLMIISYISAFDASNTPKTKKLILSISAALAMTFITVLFQFFDAFWLQQVFGLEQWYTIKMESAFGMNTISTLSLLTSSSRILAIFLWKQSLKTWNSKGIKAVALSKAPTIEWFDSLVQQAEADGQNTIVNDVEKDKNRDMISVHEMTAHISDD